MPPITQQIEKINESVANINQAAGDAGLQRLDSISTETLQTQGDFQVPETVDEPTTGLLEGALESQQDEFTQKLVADQQQTRQATFDSLSELTQLLGGSKPLETLQVEAEKAAGLSEAELEVLDIRDQRRREELAMRRSIERIQSEGGGLKSGAAAEISNIRRESLSKQADLAIVEMAALGRFNSAKAIADRQAQAVFAQQQFALQNRQFIYQENKDLFTRAEQRLFEVEFNNRERQLNEEREDFQALQSAKIEAIRMAQLNNAPTSVLQAIQTADNPEDVFEVGGQYASVDLLDRAYKAEQLANLRKKPEALRPTSVIDQGGRKLLVDTQTGEVIKDFGITDLSMKEMSTAVEQQKVNQIDDLRAHKGFNSSVGPTPGTRIAFADLTGAKDDFIAGIDNLTKNMTLQSLIDAKEAGATFGALSEGELNLLAESATKINNWREVDGDGNTKFYDASQKDFMMELDRISNMAKLDAYLKGAEPSSIGLVETPDGHVWAKNGDGSVTQLR